MDELAYWIGFNIVSGVGPVRFRALQRHFGDLKSAWEAGAEELQRAGLDRRTIANLLAAREKISLAEEVEKVTRMGARAITWDDDEYPPRLRHISRPPPVLYMKGEMLPEDEWALAVVGTRRATAYGVEATRRLAGGVARSGLSIVSGLARGIDSQAHIAALEAGGRTIAVLGSGIDVIYPWENRRLARRIVEQGAIITECPVGTAPEGRNFPPRNRIISGISLGALIAEAPRSSGALITAHHALDQGREVFAVPGSIFRGTSTGTNELIQRGEAKLVLSVGDILEELNPSVLLGTVEEREEAREIVPESEVELTLLGNLSAEEPTHIDEIGRASGLAIAEVTSTLTMMELKGFVRQIGNMRYILTQ